MTEIKIIAASAIIAILAWSGFSAKDHYKQKWQDEIHAEYAEASRKAINHRNAENEALRIKHAAINQKVISDYEKQLNDQKTSYDKRIAALRNNGGLRVPESTCRGFTSTPTAESTRPDNEASGYRLPERIESGLFELARKADEVKIQLGACQAWIIQNGFYPTSTPNIQD